MNNLVSKNPVEIFKSNFRKKGLLTSLKTGGNIPKFQTPWKPIDWNKAEEENITLGFIKGKQQERQQKEAQRTKARARANRGNSIPKVYDSTAELQEALWNIGAFNGLKDRHGRNVVFDTAVDGIRGNVTNQAIKNAEQQGYIVDINKGTVKKKVYAHGVTRPKTEQTTPQKKANTFSWDAVKNVATKIFGDLTESEEEYNKKYNTPYTLKMDRGDQAMERVIGPDGFVSYQHVERPGQSAVYSSKLGNLGLFNRQVDDDGRVCYQIKNDKGQIVTQCSETGNLIARAMGRPTTGNAWTREGIYGDELIYGDVDHNKAYGRYTQKLLGSVRPSEIDPNQLQNGDFVDLYTEGSSHNSEAATGRGNSHTGTIFKSGNNAYIIHNISGKVYVDPLAKFGPLHTWAIMGIRRPGTKEHPYYK